eukprot:5333792-Pyramimonas_sp.AAC.1
MLPASDWSIIVRIYRPSDFDDGSNAYVQRGSGRVRLNPTPPRPATGLRAVSSPTVRGLCASVKADGERMNAALEQQAAEQAAEREA